MLFVVLVLSWLSAPAVFNGRKWSRVLLSFLVDDGSVSAHPSAIVIAMPLSFCIGHLSMPLSSPSPPPSFVDCCVMFMPAANKNLHCWRHQQSNISCGGVSGGVIHPSPPASSLPVAIVTLTPIVCWLLFSLPWQNALLCIVIGIISIGAPSICCCWWQQCRQRATVEALSILLLIVAVILLLLACPPC